ncbi:MAG: hypothetical protein ACK41E_08440, partial [Deinococcales bacterium]
MNRFFRDRIKALSCTSRSFGLALVLLGLGCLQSARAQTLELSGSYPFSIQAAMYGISLSDAISL